MPTIKLSAKIHNDHQLRLVDNLLKTMVKGLKVETKICTTPRDWIQLTASGEDEKVALRYLDEKVGSTPTRLRQVEKFSTAKGYISSINKMKLNVDIGVSSPNNLDATIPLESLQAQLVDGRKVALKKIAELFGLVDNLPLTVKISGVHKEKNSMEAVLAERQLTLYRGWTKSLLDRLIVLGASSDEVGLALRRARCLRDVVNVESLGLVEYAVVCKLGTDAVGLVPKIGRKLRNAEFVIFNPKRILGFLGDYQIL